MNVYLCQKWQFFTEHWWGNLCFSCWKHVSDYRRGRTCSFLRRPFQSLSAGSNTVLDVSWLFRTDARKDSCAVPSCFCSDAVRKKRLFKRLSFCYFFCFWSYDRMLPNTFSLWPLSRGSLCWSQLPCLMILCICSCFLCSSLLFFFFLFLKIILAFKC